KILVHAYLQGGSVPDEHQGVILIRYRPDGSLDDGSDDTAGFGTGGMVQTVIDGLGGTLGLAVQTDGKIVVAAQLDGKIIVLRYLADGSPDPGFGSGGRADTGLEARPLAVGFYGEKVLVAAEFYDAGEDQDVLAALRLNGDGSPDQDFAGGGFAEGPAQTQGTFGSDGEIQPTTDGTFVVTGEANLGGPCGPSNSSNDHPFAA